MTKHHAVLELCICFMLVVSCGETPSSPLSPASRATYVGCDDPDQPCEEGPGEPPPPSGDYVEHSYCAECVGAPNIESTRAIAEINYQGVIDGIAIMKAWGNSYSVSMTVTGSNAAGQQWTSPIVSDGYSSGLLTVDGSSTSFEAKSPVATIPTNKGCGVMASGTGDFRAEIKRLDGTPWRSSSRTIQAGFVYQAPCPGDPPRNYDQAKTGGGLDRLHTDQKVCWDRYFVSGDSWTYLFTWCE